jgi:hypothetical protein
LRAEAALHSPCPFFFVDRCWFEVLRSRGARSRRQCPGVTCWVYLQRRITVRLV